MKIGGHDLRKNVLVVAEIGNNHEGDMNAARRMVEAAAASGADAVKFQRIIPEELVSFDQTARLEQLRKFRLTDDEFAALARSAQDKGVLFMATPFDVGGVRVLEPLVPAFKIASCDVNFLPLLRAVAATGKPVILSTGTASRADLLKARETLEQGWKKLGARPGLAVLHCVSRYPTAPEEAALAAIPALEGVGDVVGYSDHTLGIDAAVMAVALGARVIEKHFTLSKTTSAFRDHQLSADPGEFRAMVERIRVTERLAGDSGRLTSLERRPEEFQAIRRSAAAGRDLPAGTIIRAEDLSWVRPGTGFSPTEEDRLIGKRLARALRRGELLGPKDIV